MGYHAHGNAVIVYQTADEAVFDKAKDLFDEYLASYDFDCEAQTKRYLIKQKISLTDILQTTILTVKSVIMR